MKRQEEHKRYIAAGVTAFSVIAASMLLFFALFQWETIRAFFDQLCHILRPVLLGLVLAFLLLPVHRGILNFLRKVTNSKHQNLLNMCAIILSLLFAAVLIYLLLAMVVPQVYDSVVGLVNAIPEYIISVQTRLQTFLQNNPDIQAAVMSAFNSAAASLEQWIVSEILPNLESVSSTIVWLRDSVLPRLPELSGVVSSVSSAVISMLVLLKDLLIALIVSIYLLARKEVFAAQSKKIVYSLFPTWVGDLIVKETRNAYHIMSGFINGKLLDSLIIGIITLVCCNLFKFPYPALIATVIGVTNIIPFFGPFIGAIPCALLILLVRPIQCIYFVIFIFVLQQFDGNILGPKILGDSTGLASFWVLFSILLFGGLFGFAGMVMGVPVFAMFYSIVRQLVHWGLRGRGLSEDTEDYMGPTPPLAKPPAGEQ